jgi:hypothetical protein
MYAAGRYSLKDRPTNAVHQAIQQLSMTIDPSERDQITGVEWWAHKRPFGDGTAAPGTVQMRSYRRAYYQYHHFHFDLDDVVLDTTVSWLQLLVCMSTMSMLSAGAVLCAALCRAVCLCVAGRVGASNLWLSPLSHSRGWWPNPHCRTDERRSATSPQLTRRRQRHSHHTSARRLCSMAWRPIACGPSSLPSVQTQYSTNNGTTRRGRGSTTASSSSSAADDDTAAD